VPVIGGRFQPQLKWLDHFSQISPISNFMKIRSAIIELLQAWGQTDKAVLIGARQDCERANNDVYDERTSFEGIWYSKKTYQLKYIILSQLQHFS
jgi:hypothetical protein